ncbi:hypothetical protein PHET_10550 [Paragonimus heterotremus]|uniref:Uncharacterized protein n=1 Tax=Paragonimus heterotremus TaxID=100268 RepID=A0A8J4WTR6_9TREM|nr:hypothetical protein PHET_10550 [Paragonimus heterotremus]
MSVNELHEEVSSKCGSVNTSADGRELKLARIRIQQLELQLASKDKMEQCRIEYEEDVKRLNEQAVSVISDHTAGKPLCGSLPQSPTSPVKPHYRAMEQGCNELLDGQPSLPNNRELACHRLHGLKRRLMRDKVLYQLYVSKMEEYITSGQAELVPMPEGEEKRSTIWYLPHHPVFKPIDLDHIAINQDPLTTKSKKPAKVRVVFDCAAKYQGVDFILLLHILIRLV